MGRVKQYLMEVSEELGLEGEITPVVEKYAQLKIDLHHARLALGFAENVLSVHGLTDQTAEMRKIVKEGHAPLDPSGQ